MLLAAAYSGSHRAARQRAARAGPRGCHRGTGTSASHADHAMRQRVAQADPRLRPFPARQASPNSSTPAAGGWTGRIRHSWHAARRLNSAGQPLLAIARKRGGLLGLPQPHYLEDRIRSRQRIRSGLHLPTQSHCVIALTVSGQLLVAVSGLIPMTISTPTTRPPRAWFPIPGLREVSLSQGGGLTSHGD